MGFRRKISKIPLPFPCSIFIDIQIKFSKAFRRLPLLFQQFRYECSFLKLLILLDMKVEAEKNRFKNSNTHLPFRFQLSRFCRAITITKTLISFSFRVSLLWNTFTWIRLNLGSITQQQQRIEGNSFFARAQLVIALKFSNNSKVLVIIPLYFW